MFGHSKNPYEAVQNVQKIKRGGKAKLSLCQIAMLICNSPDAQRNLSPEEFDFYKACFNKFMSETKSYEVDLSGYYDMCNVVIGTFEKQIPFLLIDGDHSQDIEIRNQIKVRKLYDDGLKYKDALWEYENNYDKIERYTTYDSLHKPKAKEISGVTFQATIEFFKSYLKKSADNKNYGYLLGLFDALYLYFSDKYATVDTIEEGAVTLYTVFKFAIYDYSDNDIDSIMKERKESGVRFYQSSIGLTKAQVENKLTEELYNRYHSINPALDKTTINQFSNKWVNTMENKYLSLYGN